MSNVSDDTAIEILESGSLYAIAPENPKIDLDTLLSHAAIDERHELKGSSSNGRSGPFAAVPQRENLFLGKSTHGGFGQTTFSYNSLSSR